MAGKRGKRGPWADPARVARLKAMWADGKSTAAIGAALGVSAGSVSGARDRFGLPKRGKKRTPKSNGRSHKRGASPPARPERFTSDGTFDSYTPPAKRITVADLEAEHCRWAQGDPLERRSFHFCGRPKLIGTSYCEAHFRMCHRGVSVRQRAPAPAVERHQVAARIHEPA